MAKPVEPRAEPDLRVLPKVDDLLREAQDDSELVNVPRGALRHAARAAVEGMRARLRAGLAVDPAEARARLREALEAARRGSLAPVVNATGVVLHTNLGRAPLAPEAVAAVAGASQACALEMDLESGERGARDAVVSRLLRDLTGAEDATAVNNNAAATLLAVNTFALGKKVVVSRGELVEIGGSYRMPDIVRRGGAKLVEVGTTNRTRLEDYRQAWTKRVGLYMKVHTSNFRIAGFTEEVSLKALVALGRKKKVPVVHDLGSGLLRKDLTPALSGEPTVAASVEAGPDLVLFSGDKLLGGPQAGLLVGRRAAVEAIRKNPMYRAMRLDKLALAALEATLRLHAEGDAGRTVPTLARLNLDAGTLRRRARALGAKLARSGVRLELEVAQSASEAGSGSAPAVELETWCVALTRPGEGAAETARRLRLANPPVVARVRSGRVWLDPRTLAAGDDARIVAALRNAYPT